MSANDQTNPPQGGTGNVAVVGEGTGGRSEVPIQLLQQIYHEITGKSEDVSKSYSDPFQVELGDFEQLHLRLQQTLEQYEICANNCSYKIFYVDDRQESWSSVDRFKTFTGSSTSAVESVLITFDFLLILPKVKSPQPYTLTIRLASRIAIEKKMQREMMFELPRILKLMGGRTAVVTVKYVDYVVARTLLNAVEEWFGTLNKAEESKMFVFVRRHSGWLPVICRLIVAGFVAWIAYDYLPKFVGNKSTLEDLARFGLCTSVGIAGAYQLSHFLGKAAERYLDSWIELSFINLTVGDRKEIEQAKSRNSRSLVKALGSFVLGLVNSVWAKLIVVWILNGSS